MLVKYPGLSIVGAFAMAVAIAVGATAFVVISDILDSALPFPAATASSSSSSSVRIPAHQSSR